MTRSDFIVSPNSSKIFLMTALQLVEKRATGDAINYLNSNPWYWNVLADDPTGGDLVESLQTMFDTQGAQ